MQVRQQVPNAKLVFVGEGPLRQDLEQQVARCRYPDSVLFLGRTDRVAEALKALDVFVLASVAEGMPRSLLEAMATGLPCVATDVGSVGEILDGGKCGTLVPPRNAAKMGEAMLHMARIREVDRREMAAEAQRIVREHYTRDMVIERLEEIYDGHLKADEIGDFGDYIKRQFDLVLVETKTVL